LTPHVRTPSGGHHAYIVHPGFRVPTLNAKTKEALARLYPGLDIRGDGGYAIFYGVNDRGEYQWLRQPNPDPFESLAADLQALPKKCGEQTSENPAKQTRSSTNGRVQAERLVSEALKRSAGGRNDAGFWLAAQLRDNCYSQGEAEQVMLDYACRVPDENTKGQNEQYSRREALASLRQAYARPAREPWVVRVQDHAETEQEVKCGTPDLLTKHHNDHGNAERLIALHGRNLRYYHPVKRWLVWDGRRWLIDEVRQSYKLAKDTILQFLKQAIEANDRKGELFARQSLNHQRIGAMLASAECELPIRTLELDRDAYLLNCLNGTLDLRTGELKAHCREDYITKLVHLECNPDAQCPLFLRFVRRIMGDSPDAWEAEGERAARLAGYLQKVFGYALSADVSEKVIFCLFGSGNNGKTTLLEAIRFVLWEYSAHLQIDTLMSHRQRESNASLSDLADLRGARFVTTSEAEQGGRLAEGKLKSLSAGMGEVKTCRKYENPITFKATHKLFIDANHKPIVRETDQAMWNRLKLIPFDVTIPPEEIDKKLLERLMSEGQGILAWMVEGFRRWLAEGLGDPPEVAEASAGWRSEMSLLREFIEDCCEFRNDFFCPIAEIRKAYTAWANENGQTNPAWLSGFDDELIAKAGRKGKRWIGDKQVRGWVGIRLKPTEATGDGTE
jgi:putative DNA primase/helicase